MKLRSVALGTVVLGTVFGVGPAAMVRLNERCGWPRWESGAGRIIGAALILAGIGVALYATRLFARFGHGTPIPLEPPANLVVRGLYRYTRNPMYVADLAILLGIFLHRGELALLLYAGVFFAAVQSWLLWHEEPVLRRRFGAAYDRYRESVPRWLWRPGGGDRGGGDPAAGAARSGSPGLGLDLGDPRAEVDEPDRR